MPLARMWLRWIAGLAAFGPVPAGTFVAAALALAASCPAKAADPADRTAAPATAARVHATYHITWNGIDLGDFTWDSDINGGRYKAATSANLSVLLGTYTWEGVTRSAGAYVMGQPHPATYKFRFKASDKSGRVDMTFADDKISNVAQDPPLKTSAERVPLKPENLENVLDPLSGILSLTSPGTASIDGVNPCERRLPLFDGEQRFDLVLTYKRKARIENAAGAKMAYVCGIRYVPIAGMKMNNETKYMASTEGIEIWLAPVAFANSFVPVNVVIPTWAGSAQITSSRVQIDMPGRGKVALSGK